MSMNFYLIQETSSIIRCGFSFMNWGGSGVHGRSCFGIGPEEFVLFIKQFLLAFDS